MDIGMAPRSRVLAIGVGLSQQGNRGRDSAAAFAAFRAGGADIIGILAWQLQPNSQRVLGRHSLENNPRRSTSRPLRRIPAIVSFLNPQPALSLVGGNRSSCPIAAVRLREQNLG